MNIKNNLHLEPVNCGYERGTPFCLAFLFTKTGTELYTGTFELIRSKLLKHSICHGIVHYYRGKAIFAKRWCVFGENAGSNRGEIALSQLPRKIRTPNFNPFDFSRLSRRSTFQRPLYRLIQYTNGGNYDVLQTYRRMPSEYLQYFRDINKPEKQRVVISKKFKFINRTEKKLV